MARTTGPELTGRLRRGRLLPSLLPLSILANPFQWVVGVVSVVLGGGVVTTAGLALHPFTRTQTDLPAPIAVGWGALMLVGGILTVHSMRRHDRSPGTYLALESAGLVVLGAAWTVFGISPFFVRGAVYSTVFVGIMLASACLMRVHAISVGYRIARETAALQREVS